MNFFSRLIIDAAYSLQGSVQYRHQKTFFRNLLTNDDFSLKRYFDFMMIILIMTSVLIMMREVKHPVSNMWLIFNNYIISIIFLIEYLLRFWICSDNSEIIIKQYEKDTALQRPFRLGSILLKILRSKWEYVRSISAIIDLLAIVPFLHHMRLLRIFILFRVFKLFRYARSLQTFGSVLATKKYEFIALFSFASMIIFISTVMIYVMEANEPDSSINTIFDAFYWSIVTISTVGYGDITPVTNEGRFVAIVIIISGIAVISFTTSIIVSAFADEIKNIKDLKVIDNVEKLKRVYLICGYEDIAHQVALKLHRKGRSIIVLDTDPERIARAKDNNLIALPYDPGSRNSYGHLNIDFNKQVNTVLCLQEDDVQNIYTALTIRSLNKNVKILSTLMHHKNYKKLQLAGVDKIMYIQKFVGMMAKGFSGKPVAFETMHALRSEQTSVNLTEIIVDERISQNYAFVRELKYKSNHLILMGIYKQDKKKFFFNPTGETALEIGDTLLFIGEQTFLAEFNLLLHNKRGTHDTT